MALKYYTYISNTYDTHFKLLNDNKILCINGEIREAS